MSKVILAFHWARNNWFRLATLFLLAVICWQLTKIQENTSEISEIRDGIEVEIVDNVDGLLNIRIPSIKI